MKTPLKLKERRRSQRRQHLLLLVATALFFILGFGMLWAASLNIPALEDLSERKITGSTKIYDRTGGILLYDLSQDAKRTLISFEAVSPYVKAATIAIEDKEFYTHKGIKFSSFIRAMLVNLGTLSFRQGGSTITQQVVKNLILTKNKTPARKLKEWILAQKLENLLTKDEILNFYLNEIPYGGNIYGVEEAARSFFDKSASKLTLAESAYLAALPKAPTYYSPYGRNKDKLEERKNLVLKLMLEGGSITGDEYNQALKAEVSFKPRENNQSIKAPHFVFFLIDYLVEKYGEDAVRSAGFKVISSIDYEIQKAAEESAKKYGPINEKQFNGENNALIAIDPKTGEILAMVGSRDYFDNAIEGNFNVATAHRQPGSAFKPIVYSTLFNKGFTPETILFDVPTQFSTACAAENLTSEGNCYSPRNYDNKYSGPVTVRNALAQSRNIPAVEALYLAGVKNSLKLAKEMGIESFEGADRYGLTLVLGGGEVSLLDLTSAYSVLANDGFRNPYISIIRIEDSSGEVLTVSTPIPARILPEQTARQISSILNDDLARSPLYGAGSLINIPGRDLAVKTGTTNDYRDAWVIGYAPNIVVGAWVGNNDNSPMEKKVSGLIVVPVWRDFVDKILSRLPVENFPAPEPTDPSVKAILRGEWRGGYVTPVTNSSGQVVDQEYAGGIHSILHWIDKDDPRGPVPSNPADDPQYKHWEWSVRNWARSNGYGDDNDFVPAPTDISVEQTPPPQLEPEPEPPAEPDNSSY